MKTTLKQKLVESQTTNFLKTRQEIADWLRKFNIQNFEIHDDMTVTVNENIELHGVSEIPVKFREVNGNIDVSNNNLTRIDWAPRVVNGRFDVWDNQLTTLVGGPEEVKLSFDCDNNKLTSLEGAPKIVGGAFICSSNPLRSLKGCPEEVKGFFKAVDCDLNEIDDFPKKIGTSIHLQKNNLRSLKNISKFLREFTDTSSLNTGSVNIYDNPIESGLLSLCQVKKFEKYNTESLHKTQTNQLFSAVKIINDGVNNGLDPFDIQDSLEEANLGSFA